MKKSNKKQSGFTLIELLVVISIIALLLAVMMPALATAKERAKRLICSTRLHQDSIAIQAYAADYRGRYPTPLNDAYWPANGVILQGNKAIPAGLSLLMTQGYINSFDFFYCPASPTNYLNKDNIFNLYQKRYLETGKLSDINWDWNNGGGVWYSYLYWVAWGNGMPENNPLYPAAQKLAKTLAYGPRSRPDTVVITDNIITRRNRPEDNYPYHKIPHEFASHVNRAQLQGGYVLYNGGNVEWKKMEDLQRDFNRNMKLDFRHTNMYYWF